MKRPDRYYLPALAEHGAGDIVSLDAREGAHAARVKRHVAGSTIELFDGAGRHARAVVTSADRRRGVAARIEETADEPPPATGVHLACAVPRGDRMETLLDMTTQLGVTRVTPLRFEHSTPAGERGRHDRWHRVVVEASKQSRRHYLPILDPVASYGEWLLQGIPKGCTRWLADPAGAAPASHANAPLCVVVVGPEGGLAEAEREAALAAGFVAVTFGENVLRVETAAVAAVAAAQRAGTEGKT